MLKKLFHYFRLLIVKLKPKKSQNNDLTIKISLKPDYTVNIDLEYPDLENYDLFNIAGIAEKYAELVTFSSTSALKYKLLEIIENKAYSTENIKEKLFFDNVCTFHEIIKKEIKNNQNNSPLIRPTSVFNGK